jgi:hypothetical protein
VTVIAGGHEVSFDVPEHARAEHEIGASLLTIRGIGLRDTQHVARLAPGTHNNALPGKGSTKTPR